MTQAFRRTYSFSECASFRAWRKYPSVTPNSTHVELWDAPNSQISRQVIAGLWPSMRRMPNCNSWHNPDLQRPLELGPIMPALPTFGAECRFTTAFQTLRWHAAKVGS